MIPAGQRSPHVAERNAGTSHPVRIESSAPDFASLIQATRRDVAVADSVSEYHAIPAFGMKRYLIESTSRGHQSLRDWRGRRGVRRLFWHRVFVFGSPHPDPFPPGDMSARTSIHFSALINQHVIRTATCRSNAKVSPGNPAAGWQAVPISGCSSMKQVSSAVRHWPGQPASSAASPLLPAKTSLAVHLSSVVPFRPRVPPCSRSGTLRAATAVASGPSLTDAAPGGDTWDGRASRTRGCCWAAWTTLEHTPQPTKTPPISPRTSRRPIPPGPTTPGWQARPRRSCATRDSIEASCAAVEGHEPRYAYTCFQCRQEEDAHLGAEVGHAAGEAAGRGSTGPPRGPESAMPPRMMGVNRPTP
jgi:hypothetical protein